MYESQMYMHIIRVKELYMYTYHGVYKLQMYVHVHV